MNRLATLWQRTRWLRVLLILLLLAWAASSQGGQWP